MLEVLLLAIVFYLVGSFPTAYVIGRLAKGIDIRRYGSGNVGGANAWQMIGRWAFVLVTSIDVAKGALGVLTAELLGLGLLAQVLVALATVAGHNWSTFLGFTGGRGISTTLGALLLLAPSLVLFFVAVAAAGILLRRIPLWIGFAMVCLPFASLALGKPSEITFASAAFALLIFTKRMTANWEKPALADWRRVAVNRLLFDRDIVQREPWIHRMPPDGERPR